MCISDKLLFDSYLGDTNEVMFSYFVLGIEKVFNKNIKDYKLAILKTKNIHTEYLEDYLLNFNYPYQAKGFDIPNRREIPIRLSFQVDKENKLLRHHSFGFYNIFRNSEKEIFFYFCESDDYNSEKVTFIAFKNLKALQHILDDLKQYYMKANNIDQKIFIHGKKELIKEDIHWNDIILPETLKKDIQLSVNNFLRGKHIYHKMGLPYKRGLLFTGAPGNGKTMLCKIISMESCLPFILFAFDDDSIDYDIERAFEKAEELSPAILCFEDLESIGKLRLTLSYFLNKIDGFEPLEGILILATTNKPEEIDPALCNRPSRFDRIFRITNPEYQSRLLMLKKYLNDSVGEDTLQEIASATEDFSMAYLKELYIYSAMIALEKGNEVPSKGDLLQALETLKYQLKNGCKPFDKIGSQKVGFSAKV